MIRVRILYFSFVRRIANGTNDMPMPLEELYAIHRYWYTVIPVAQQRFQRASSRFFLSAILLTRADGIIIEGNFNYFLSF